MQGVVARYDAPLQAAIPTHRLARELSARGYAHVEDWGLDVDALQRAVDASGITARGGWMGGRQVRSHLGPLPINFTALRDTLFAAARDYLGDDAELSGYSVLRLGGRLDSADEYVSGKWHHDRCGRRLKAFILLNEVTLAGGHMTRVLPGTHLQLHSFASFRTSRFNQITEEGSPMLGRRGGGYIIDTNAVHKGDLNGTVERLSVILEFNMREKSARLRGIDPAVPCPSLLRRQVLVLHRGAEEAGREPPSGWWRESAAPLAAAPLLLAFLLAFIGCTRSASACSTARVAD